MNYIRRGRHGIGQFRFLLIAIVLMFVLRPFLEGYAAIGFLSDIFFSLILLSGAYALSHQGKVFFVAVGIAVPALALELASYFLPSEPISIVKNVFFFLFFAYIEAIILSKIFGNKEITEDTITGATCAYFLIGTLWTYVFYFLELSVDGSFSSISGMPHDVSPFLYFSFVTLATLGYGDIVPKTDPARSLAVLEAVTGQLYLAVTIARLVGLHASQSRFKEGQHEAV